MFNLFGKKKENKTKEESSALTPDTQAEEYRAFAAHFLPEELDILAVTGASGFGGGQAAGDQLWTAGIGLTAWMEEDSPDIHQGQFRLVTKADETLLGYLRQRTPRDFIIKCRARPSEDGKRLLLTNLPEPGFDPDLKAILEEQVKPVSTWVEGLGTFVLERSANWFQAEVEWLGQPAQLSFDRDEVWDDCIQSARTLMAGQADWDAKVRACAADKLLDLANQWAQDGGSEDEEPEEVTREQFMERMEMASIQVWGDGSFQFWFNDGDLFWGHAIHVSGSLAEGPTDAQMEG